jgi:hypothetical protein
MFKKGNTHGKGRPLGSQNKVPNKDELIKLLNAIVEDFSIKFDELSTDDKLRLLNAFRHLWRMEIENVFPVDNEIKIKIIERDEP